MEYAFLDLLNSDWHDWRGSGKSEDRLDNFDWINKFLTSLNLQIDVIDYQQLSSALKELRSLIKNITNKIINTTELSLKDLECLNAMLVNTSYQKKITWHETDLGIISLEADSQRPSASEVRLEFNPVHKDINWILTEIIVSLADVLVNRDPLRIKICANHDCGWFFYDESRGMTRNWCDSKICGNLIKVRRFREKQKQNNDS